MSDAYICPHCKNPIYDEDALLCHFCGESLNRSSQGALGKMRYGGNRLWWYVLAAIVLLALIRFFVL